MDGFGSDWASGWRCGHNHELVANKGGHQGRCTRADNVSEQDSGEGYFPTVQVVLQGLVVGLWGIGGLPAG